MIKILINKLIIKLWIEIELTRSGERGGFLWMIGCKSVRLWWMIPWRGKIIAIDSSNTIFHSEAPYKWKKKGVHANIFSWKHNMSLAAIHLRPSAVQKSWAYEFLNNEAIVWKTNINKPEGENVTYNLYGEWISKHQYRWKQKILLLSYYKVLHFS